MTIRPKGKSWDVRIEPVRTLGRAAGGFFRQVTRDQVTVVPVDALPLIKSGVLDRALFDVTGLVQQRLDDAHSREIPLLVKAPDSRKAAGLGRITRRLPAAGLTAVAVPKAARPSAPASGAPRPGGTPRPTSAPLDLAALQPGTRIWLNGRAKPSLDASVPQIGAPAAWQAGHTGAGVRVAVLDTGYDPNHGDLAGAVKDSKDFTGDDLRDVVGHGTHVASIIAGRGTASQGRHTGVAKGVDLLVGKVCEPFGCPFDAIIAGMQWAAASGADVVNLSLGGWPTDGTDPLSTELNRLTESTGTLFVVAAGNDGPTGLVSSPASADGALAVGSVTKQDQLSEFSSVGPRLGDYAVKPDLVAPGSDIVAARAAGTLADEAVDENYARLSGTSMATPHVAGAAAILAGQHPDWKAGQLKAALMASAHPIQAGVFAQGTGRVDVARAVAQSITTTPASVSFKAVSWPNTGAPDQSRKITYHNIGEAPVTLGLRLDFRDHDGKAAEGAKLSADSVMVPAKGTADVTLTIAPGTMATGTYSGRVTASTADETIVVQTTAGIYVEPESYDLTLQLVDRDGKTLPPGSTEGGAVVQDLADQSTSWFPVRSGETVRVPAGRYAVLSWIYTPVPGQTTPSITSGAVPEVEVRADREVRIDARTGHPARVQVDRKDARLAAGTVGMMLQRENFSSGLTVGLVPDQYAIPVRADDDFAYYTRAQLERAQLRLVEEPDLEVEWAPDSARFVGTRVLDSVDAGRARPEDLEGKDLAGKLALFTLKAEDGDVFQAGVDRLREAGAAAVLFYFSEPTSLSSEKSAIPTMYIDDPSGARLAGRRLTIEAKGESPYRYELAIPEVGGIPAELQYRIRDHQLAAIRSSYHSPVPGAVGYVDFSTWAGKFDMGSAIWSTVVRPPVQRTEYYSPVSWSTSVRIAQGGDETHEQGFSGPERDHRAGERLAVNWNKPVLGPGFGPLERRDEERPLQAYRDGDKIDVLLPLLTDSDNHSGLTRPEDYSYADKGETALYADGKLVGRSDVPDAGVFTVPAGSAQYRLTAEVRRTDPAWPLATRVTADWTFRSATTDKPTALRLPTVRLDPAVDLLGTAPAGREFAIPVTVPSGKLRKVEVSYDDGKTWTTARLRSTGRAWTATVRHPASGFVSIRSTATDSQGNQVVQATYRAYRLK